MINDYTEIRFANVISVKFKTHLYIPSVNVCFHLKIRII